MQASYIGGNMPQTKWHTHKGNTFSSSSAQSKYEAGSAQNQLGRAMPLLFQFLAALSTPWFMVACPNLCSLMAVSPGSLCVCSVPGFHQEMVTLGYWPTLVSFSVCKALFLLTGTKRFQCIFSCGKTQANL